MMATARKDESAPITRILSGGQTGVDRAALDAARTAGLAHGGWCPKGRRAEDGSIPAIYPLQETPSADYRRRTDWNVRDSDGTLIVTAGTPTGGTALTIECAEKAGKPRMTVHPEHPEEIPHVLDWIGGHAIAVLNVAGPRESESPGIHDAAFAFLLRMLGGATSD